MRWGRRWALGALGVALLCAGLARADEERLRFLIDRLASGDSWKIRMAAALALGKLDSADALIPMYEGLRTDESEPVRLALAGALGHQEYYEAFVALSEAGLEVHGLKGKTAQRVLDQLFDKRSVFDLDAWRDLLAERGQARLRARAAWILGVCGDKGATKLLIKSLRDKDAGVRRAAALALGRLGARKARKALAKVARDKDPRARQAAKAALKLVGKGGYKPKRLDGLEYPAMIDPEAYQEALPRLRPMRREPDPEPPPPGPAPEPAPDRRGYPEVSWDRFEPLLQTAMTEVLNSCIGRLPKGTKVRGVAKVRFGLDGEGGITEPEITEDGVAVAAVTDCLVSELGDQQFAALPEGVNMITYGFDITAGQDQRVEFDEE